MVDRCRVRPANIRLGCIISLSADTLAYYLLPEINLYKIGAIDLISSR